MYAVHPQPGTCTYIHVYTCTCTHVHGLVICHTHKSFDCYMVHTMYSVYVILRTHTHTPPAVHRQPPLAGRMQAACHGQREYSSSPLSVGSRPPAVYSLHVHVHVYTCTCRCPGTVIHMNRNVMVG